MHSLHPILWKELCVKGASGTFYIETLIITAHFVSRRGLPSFAVELWRNVQNGFTTSLWYCKYACSFNSELGRSPDGIQLEIFKRRNENLPYRILYFESGRKFSFLSFKSSFVQRRYSFFCDTFLSLPAQYKERKVSKENKTKDWCIICHPFLPKNGW